MMAMMDGFFNKINPNSIGLCLIIVLICCCFQPSASADKPATIFYNHNNCLFANMGNTGDYYINIPAIPEIQKGQIQNINIDDTQSYCYKDSQTSAKLVMSSQINDNYMYSMKIEFELGPPSTVGFWEIKTANLTINPVNSKLFTNEVIPLKTTDMYAGRSFSYSCGTLTLQNAFTNKDGITFKINLYRFQVQPFEYNNPKYVFAPSFDCEVWLTIPQISGLILVLFVTFIAMIGVYLIAEQGNQNGDLKFSKQGGMLLNQAQLDATKG